MHPPGVVMSNHMFEILGVRRVADCHHNTCVANVAALVKNREENGCYWTAKSIQEEYGLVLQPNGKSNVPNIPKALTYLERATVRRRSRGDRVRFQEARVIGDYAIFISAHVVYGVIEPGMKVFVLDANVGRGFEGWESFFAYARTNGTLYGPDPEGLNECYRLVEEEG
jgi:hypothetical protein